MSEELTRFLVNSKLNEEWATKLYQFQKKATDGLLKQRQNHKLTIQNLKSKISNFVKVLAAHPSLKNVFYQQNHPQKVGHLLVDTRHQ